MYIIQLSKKREKTKPEKKKKSFSDRVSIRRGNKLLGPEFPAEFWQKKSFRIFLLSFLSQVCLLQETLCGAIVVRKNCIRMPILSDNYIRSPVNSRHLPYIYHICIAHNPTHSLSLSLSLSLNSIIQFLRFSQLLLFLAQLLLFLAQLLLFLSLNMCVYVQCMCMVHGRDASKFTSMKKPGS